MKILFAERAWEDYLYWQRTDKAILRRINQVIGDIQREPSEGIGKPELLRFGLSGYWSRRIDSQHRLVYKVDGDVLYVVQCRYHY